MPPWAHRVEPSSMFTLVTTVTCSPASRRCSAQVSPATPEPTTTTSVVSAQPGSGPANRRGNEGSGMPAVFHPASVREAAGLSSLDGAGQFAAREFTHEAAVGPVADRPEVARAAPEQPPDAARAVQSGPGQAQVRGADAVTGVQGGGLHLVVARVDIVRAEIDAGELNVVFGVTRD